MSAEGDTRQREKAVVFTVRGAASELARGLDADV